MDKPAAFYVPVNLDPCEFPPEQRDYACYFLNVVHWRRICWRADDAGYVRLKWEYLTKIIPPRTWSWVSFCLMNPGRKGGPVVESDHRFIRGQKATGYRLAPNYRRVRRIVCTNEMLNRKIRRLYAREDANQLPVHRWLRGHFDRLQFDARRAESIIAELAPDDTCPMTAAEYRSLVSDQCQRLADGEYRLCCDRFGRVHTNITSLHRKLRCCLSVEGTPLVGWDLANSQPLMAGLLARRYCRSADARWRMSNTSFEGETNPYCYRAFQEFRDHPGVLDDVREHIRCCEAGTCYESFGTDREKIKKGFMSILMGHNCYRGPVKDAFKAKYPTVATMLHSLREKDHARAAWLLQNLEATIFIHRVCGQLMEKFPDLPVFTIHDSLFTTPAGSADVRDAILDTFGRLGITPKLKQC